MENETSIKNKVDLIQTAIQQLLESKQPPHLHNNNNDDEDHHHHLLTNLLSQLEALKADGVLESPEAADAESKEEVSSCKSVETDRRKGEETSESRIVSESEDVVKQLKKLEQQNRVTHWLLSALILLTVTWQLSEVSLLYKLKQGLTNPFKSFGNMFKNILKRHRPNEQEQSKLPYVELPDLIMNDENK